MPNKAKDDRQLKVAGDGIEVELIGIKDESLDAEIQSARVQELVDRMINLGRKRGRPRKEGVHHEEKAA